MSEKYTRVYHSTDLMYAESSPVIVMARALLKDNGAGGIFAQLKFKSISDKIIKAIKVKIIPLDTTGNLIGDSVEHTYLDLKISRNQEFGSKEIISVSEITARAFNVSIKQVVFADNYVWECEENEYEKIDNLVLLNAKISNPELVEQYKIELGDDSNYVPMKIKDLWVCTCGNYNHISEEKCKNCGKVFEKEIELLDLNVLQEKYNKRLEKESEEKRVAEEKQRLAEEEKRIAAEKIKKKIKKAIAISAPIICAIIALVILLNTVIIPKQKYKKAMNLIASEQFDEAYKILEELGKGDEIEQSKYDRAIKMLGSDDYEKAYALLEEVGKIDEVDQSKYDRAMKLIDEGDCKSARNLLFGVQNYDGKQLLRKICSVFDRKTISAGSAHTVGLKSDGTVAAVSNDREGRCDVSGWSGIVTVSAGAQLTVGLKSDGTVVAVGGNYDGECNVSDLSDIVALSAGTLHTVGLKSDGSVVAVGYNGKGERNVSMWSDIVAISAGYWHTVGLKSDGTVVAVGENDDGQCDVSDWSDIIAISAGNGHTAGLKSDGTVVAVGSNGSGQCNVSSWHDIVEISAGYAHTIGLKSDGTVVAVGGNYDGQCNVSSWNNIALPPTNEQIAEILKNK